MPEREGAGGGIIGDFKTNPMSVTDEEFAQKFPGIRRKDFLLTAPWDAAEQWAASGWNAIKPYLPFTGHFPDSTPKTPQDTIAQGREIVDRVMGRRPLRPPQTPGGIIGDWPVSHGPSQYGTDALPSADTLSLIHI